MARTTQQIFDDLIVRKDADSVLSLLLTSASKVALFRAVFWLIAEVMSAFEQTFDTFSETITDLLVSKQVHTRAWFRRTALAFQLGDPLIQLANGNLGYSEVDTDKQIVQRAAVLSTTDAIAIVKVAKLVSGSPQPLDPSELGSFESYYNDVKPFTTSILVISQQGDELRVGLDVLVDTQVINTTDGTLIADSAIKPVEAAIISYLGTFENDDFGGVFYGNRLLISALNTTGVINATFSLLSKKSTGDTSFIDLLADPDRAFETFSGYLRFADGFDLSANLTYTGNV